MKKIFTKTLLVLIGLLVVVSIASAQKVNTDRRITFTVRPGADIKFCLTADEIYTPIQIRGDDINEIIRVGTVMEKIYTYRTRGEVIHILGDVKELFFADVNSNPNVTSLDVSSNTGLTNLSCSYCKLTTLDVSKDTKLTSLACNNNALSLLNLKKLSDIASIARDNKQLGTQTLPAKIVVPNTAITIDSVFNGKNTTFNITLNGNAAIKNTDYTITGGVITFKREGLFEVSITNPGLISDTSYPAKVVARFIVSKNNINMNRYINLKAEYKAGIRLDFAADADNTPVRIVSGTTDETIVAGTDWGGTKTFSVRDETVTVYGDITKFNCSNNTSNITGLDISKNTALTDLNCNDTNLTDLDISKNTALTDLKCSFTNLTGLDLSKNTALVRLECYANQLTTLDVSKNTALTHLNCSLNKLTTLDVSNNKALTDLTCFDTNLTALDVSNNTALTRLLCHTNQLTTLDVSNNTNLASLWCYNNNLTTLDLSRNTALYSLRCNNNNLTTLDVSKNTALIELHCNNNALSWLNLKELSDILSIEQNNTLLGMQTLPLEFLEPNTTITIDSVFNGGNTIFNVTVNGNTAIKNTDYTITGGKITFKSEGLFRIAMMHPTIISNTNDPTRVIARFIVSRNDLNMERCIKLTVKPETDIKLDFAADAANIPVKIVSGTTDETIVAGTDWGGAKTFRAQAETMTVYGDITKFRCNNNTSNVLGLDVSDNTALTALNCSDNNLITLDVSKNAALTELNCSGNYLNLLDVSKNKALIQLNYSNTSLTAVDISENSALALLDCSNLNTNRFITLDLSKNKALIQLNCSNTKLTGLDLSGNTALTTLWSNGTQLTTLDVSKNTALKILCCASNKLTTLDLSKNTALTQLECYENGLSLLNLKKLSGIGSITQNNKYLGTQTLSYKELKPNTAIMIDSVFNGKNTVFKVTLNGNTAGKNTDYTITGGVITFKSEGLFDVSITNPELISNTNYPAKVVARFIVSETGTNTERYITLTVKPGADIRFDFSADIENTPVKIVNGTTDEVILVGTNWVDIKTATVGTETITIYGDITRFICSNNFSNLTGLDVSKNTALTALACTGNSLSTLDVSKNTKLTWFECGSNNLTTLDLSNNTALLFMYSYDNALSLANLKKLSDIKSVAQHNKWLGTQTLPVEVAEPNTSITIDSVFNGVNTTFNVTVGGNTAIEDNDYTITGGNIIFKRKGMFEVSITNPGLISYTNRPAKVVARFNVGNISSDAALASLSVSEGTLTPAFNPTATDYTVSVGYSTASITITASANDINAKVEGAGTKDLNVGDNDFEIVVTAEDGTENTYKLMITREANLSGMDDVKQESIQIYPNRISDYFYIKGVTHPTTLSIYTMYGKMVLQREVQAEENIFAGNLPSGLYLITVKGKTFKVIKK